MSFPNSRPGFGRPHLRSIRDLDPVEIIGVIEDGRVGIPTDIDFAGDFAVELVRVCRSWRLKTCRGVAPRTFTPS